MAGNDKDEVAKYRRGKEPSVSEFGPGGARFGEQCQHGNLARKCEACFEEWDQLDADVDSLRHGLQNTIAAQAKELAEPTVVCLCGSTRFSSAFSEANLRETLAGKIVLSIGCDFKSDQALGLTDADKVRLDELHLRKIDLADEVLILNVGGYVGESTKRELAYARIQGKFVRFLEAPK